MQLSLPTIQDLFVLIIAYLWIFGVLGFGELLRRWRNYSTSVTRKIIHLLEKSNDESIVDSQLIPIEITIIEIITADKIMIRILRKNLHFLNST